MPPSSLYWIQKSASSSSNAAGNRRSAASPGVRPPRLAFAVPVPPSSPTPIVPAPAASDLPRNARRLMKRCRGLDFFSDLLVRERSPLLIGSVAAGLLVVFMTVTSQQLMVSAVQEK